MSLRIRVFNLFLRATLKQILAAPVPIGLIRLLLKYSSRLTLWRPAGVKIRVEPANPGGVPMTWVQMGAPRAGSVLLFLHGGGYCFGEPSIYIPMLARLSKNAAIAACAPSYRLAPEHPFPAQIEDALASWDALREQGFSSNNIVIAGDSAGGGLALYLVAELLKRGEKPAGVVAMSPWTDLTFSGQSWTENRTTEVVLPVRLRRRSVQMVTGGDADVALNSRISPLFADFSGAPPVLIHYSTAEVLRDDGAEMARRLRAAGVEVHEDVQPNLPHVWQTYDPWLTEAGRSLDLAAKFMRHVLPDPFGEN